MRRRTIKLTPTGDLPRSHVRNAVQAVHVQAKSPDAWEVKTLGTKGQTKLFPSREAAVSYAKKIPTASSVVVHGTDGTITWLGTSIRQPRQLSP